MAKKIERKRAHSIHDRRAEHESRAQAASYLDLAHGAYQARQVPESIAHAEKALRIYPNYMSAHALLAEAYFNHQRDYRRAARHFQILIAHNYANRSLPYFLGVCYDEGGQYQKARETFTGFLEREQEKRLPAQWRLLKSGAREFIERCDHALSTEAWRAERLKGQKAQDALQKVRPAETAPPVAPPPTTQPIEPEPRSIRISVSFGDGHLPQRVLDQGYQPLEDYRLALQYHHWKLINTLQKTFILLLSATPVQNNLVELYNLITVLKPGLLKIEAQFKQEYVKQCDGRCFGHLRQLHISLPAASIPSPIDMTPYTAYLSSARISGSRHSRLLIRILIRRVHRRVERDSRGRQHGREWSLSPPHGDRGRASTGS